MRLLIRREEAKESVCFTHVVFSSECSSLCLFYYSCYVVSGSSGGGSSL